MRTTTTCRSTTSTRGAPPSPRPVIALAAVIVEPLVDVMADPEWLHELRTQCDHLGAVLIFDEVKTGFRIFTWRRAGGARCDAASHTVLGKAIANGYPLAAVVGTAEVMAATNRTWISQHARHRADWHRRGACGARPA